VFKDVYIAPLQRGMISQVSLWLQNPIIKYSFVSRFPTHQSSLREYFAAPDRQYFGIFSQGHYVGIIGADGMERGSRKLEMRKFIGDVGLHGRGIGKCATFLFLYYCFMILDFNKVYIHSGDTNISNINLNSQLGFELEGILFEDAIVDDERRDVVRMGLLKSRWEEVFLNRHPVG
jgi:RimJ/RimL family protein N-acetyltransferase